MQGVRNMNPAEDSDPSLPVSSSNTSRNIAGLPEHVLDIIVEFLASNVRSVDAADDDGERVSRQSGLDIDAKDIYSSHESQINAGAYASNDFQRLFQASWVTARAVYRRSKPKVHCDLSRVPLAQDQQQYFQALGQVLAKMQQADAHHDQELHLHGMCTASLPDSMIQSVHSFYCHGITITPDTFALLRVAHMPRLKRLEFRDPILKGSIDLAQIKANPPQAPADHGLVLAIKERHSQYAEHLSFNRSKPYPKVEAAAAIVHTYGRCAQHLELISPEQSRWALSCFKQVVAAAILPQLQSIRIASISTRQLAALVEIPTVTKIVCHSLKDNDEFGIFEAVPFCRPLETLQLTCATIYSLSQLVQHPGISIRDIIITFSVGQSPLPAAYAFGLIPPGPWDSVEETILQNLRHRTSVSYATEGNMRFDGLTSFDLVSYLLSCTATQTPAKPIALWFWYGDYMQLTQNQPLNIPSAVGTVALMFTRYDLGFDPDEESNEELETPEFIEQCLMRPVNNILHIQERLASHNPGVSRLVLSLLCMPYGWWLRFLQSLGGRVSVQPQLRISAGQIYSLWMGSPTETEIHRLEEHARSAGLQLVSLPKVTFDYGRGPKFDEF